MSRLLLSLACSLLLNAAARAGDKGDRPITARHQVTGLFAPDRALDLREVFAKIPEVELKDLDFKLAEATLVYTPAKAFPGAKPAQCIERLDNLVRNASAHTFGIKPLRTTPLDRLTWIDIGVAGLDCKACALAAYESVYRLDGVECATVDFRAGRLTALIDPAKTDRTKLAAALEKRGVKVSDRK
jgi:hypothetical protein